MPDLSYDSNRPLFLFDDNQRFTLADADQCIAAAYAKNLPVLVYLHGRAKDVGEPKKSVENGTYTALSQEYKVTVIGFTWDADDGGYDESRPIASADDFVVFLSALRKHIALTQAPLPSLLAHSMGNLIIAELAKDDLLNVTSGFFSNIVLNAAAVKTKRHNRWLDKLQAAKQVYVLVNSHDVVLSFAGFLFKPNMLGKELQNLSHSSAVRYVDISELGVNHRYFLPSRQNKKQNLKRFFAATLTGQVADLGQLAQQDFQDGVAVFKMNNG